MTSLKLAPYATQNQLWPTRGRHILAQFDAQSVVVYQAYRPEIADYAAQHGRFGGPFSFNRMSWIKPNFLWMMYRSGWATKEGQERVLALTISRPFFESLLWAAVPSSHSAAPHLSAEDWKAAVAQSDVRLQWDPDHAPNGQPLTRRAVQLGLRGATLRAYGGPQLLKVEDITPFVTEQRRVWQSGGELLTPQEAVYPVTDPLLIAQLGLDAL